jgi:hypothetical protein
MMEDITSSGEYWVLGDLEWICGRDFCIGCCVGLLWLHWICRDGCLDWRMDIMKGILSRYIFAFDFCVEIYFKFALRISLA